MENNWLWLVAGAAIDWVGTRFGTLVKDVLRRYLLRRVIVSELRQLHEGSSRLWTSLARALRISELEAYQKYVDSYRDEFKNIIASAKGLTREDFERAYRPARPPEPGFD